MSVYYRCMPLDALLMWTAPWAGPPWLWPYWFRTRAHTYAHAYAPTHARTHARTHTHTHTHVRTHSRTDSRTHPRAPWMEQDGYTREQCEVLGRPFYAAKAGVGKKWGMFCVN